jgi:hypothetical protein
MTDFRHPTIRSQTPPIQHRIAAHPRIRSSPKCDQSYGPSILGGRRRSTKQDIHKFIEIPAVLVSPVFPKLFEPRHTKPGVANPRPAGRMRPRKEFLRPKLGLKLGDFSIFWVFFHSFYQNLAQKINIFGNFPKCGPKTDLGWPPLH